LRRHRCAGADGNVVELPIPSASAVSGCCRAAACEVVCWFGAREPVRALFAAQEAANGMPDNLQRLSGIELVFLMLGVSNELA
jgi:hypothetical protein